MSPRLLRAGRARSRPARSKEGLVHAGRASRDQTVPRKGWSTLVELSRDQSVPRRTGSWARRYAPSALRADPGRRGMRRSKEPHAGRAQSRRARSKEGLAHAGRTQSRPVRSKEGLVHAGRAQSRPVRSTQDWVPGSALRAFRAPRGPRTTGKAQTETRHTLVELSRDQPVQRKGWSTLVEPVETSRPAAGLGPGLGAARLPRSARTQDDGDAQIEISDTLVELSRDQSVPRRTGSWARRYAPSALRADPGRGGNAQTEISHTLVELSRDQPVQRKCWSTLVELSRDQSVPRRTGSRARRCAPSAPCADPGRQGNPQTETRHTLVEPVETSRPARYASGESCTPIWTFPGALPRSSTSWNPAAMCSAKTSGSGMARTSMFRPT